MPPAAASRSTAAAPAADRRQSTRQGRTSVTRPSNYYARGFTGRMAALGGLEQTPPASNAAPGFLPAITHFTSAAEAFPKEMIKHYSMFKEVEAKIHDPDHALQLLLDEIAKLPVPTAAERQKAAQNPSILARENSTNPSVNGSVMDGNSRFQQLSVELFPPDFKERSPEEQADLRKRQLFFRLRMVIASMLPTLDEKLVVLTSAKGAMDKCLARMNSSYVHMDEEISEEARYGSLNHWAYADKEEKKKGGTTERHRREVASANNLAAAAQQVHDADSIAAKSEARREAMLAKRNRNQHVDSDFDDNRPVKKTQKRKVATTDNALNDPRGIGLGITSAPSQPGKRKKTEKALAAAAAAAPAMERSLSGALQSAATGARNGTSPRATPAAETAGKRKPRAAPANGPGRKRAVGGAAASPLLVSSPLTSAFPASKDAAQRPPVSRARKPSIANSVTSAAPEPAVAGRPSSSQSASHPNNNSNAITEPEQAAGVSTRDETVAKDAPTPKEPLAISTAPTESSSLKHEDAEPQEPDPMDVDRPSPPAVATRAGRASKTATPVVGTFPEIPMVRSRSTRNANNGAAGSSSHTSSENNSTAATTTTKRGHKKSVSTHTAALPSPALQPIQPAPKSPHSSTASSPAPDLEFSEGVDEDGDEPRYCYCNEVSYGNMIACDNTECPKEWFHLACVNMEKAPSARAKWFCSDTCREAYSKKAKGGRPGSSRQ